jgi:hypothetical protein
MFYQRVLVYLINRDLTRDLPAPPVVPHVEEAPPLAVNESEGKREDA